MTHPTDTAADRRLLEMAAGDAPQFRLFNDGNARVELRVQAILVRRRALNVSGRGGEDIDNIRAAAAIGEAMPAPPHDGGAA